MRTQNRFAISQTLFSIFLFFLLPTYIYATSQQDTFQRYPNPVFVETGSLWGQGIQYALNAGFSEVHSIELSSKYYNICEKRFENCPQVHIWEGDSAELLAAVIKDIREPITFWLDGHCSLCDTAKGETMTPVLKELEQIKQHPIKTHTILVDDVRQFGTWYFDGTTLEQITEKIYEINPNYTIKFENGHVENDILVAYIPN